MTEIKDFLHKVEGFDLPKRFNYYIGQVDEENDLIVIDGFPNIRYRIIPHGTLPIYACNLGHNVYSMNEIGCAAYEWVWTLPGARELVSDIKENGESVSRTMEIGMMIWKSSSDFKISAAKIYKKILEIKNSLEK